MITSSDKRLSVLAIAVLLITMHRAVPADAATTMITVGTNPVGVGVNAETRRVYVANRGSNTISVIDADLDRVVATIPEGGVPTGVAVNPRTNRVYVSNLARTLSVIDGSSNTEIATIGVGVQPFALDVNIETNRIYVANRLDRNVTVIDGATNTVMTTIDVGGAPSGVAVDPLTNRVYVANNALNHVAVIDGASHQIVAQITTPAAPSDIAVNPETRRIYVTTSPSLTMIDATTHAVLVSTELTGAITSVALNPRLNLVYALGIGTNRVSILDGPTNVVLGVVDLAGFSGDLDVDPVSSKVYVAQYFAGATAVISVADLSSPVITASISPTPSASGWHNQSVVVIWSATDAESGIAGMSGCATTTLTLPTHGTPVTCLATNGSGLSTTRTITVKIDRTPPSIRAQATTADGFHYVPELPGMWARSAVTVRYTCTDPYLPAVPSSGLASCPEPQTYNAEGTTIASATASDQAGNATTILFGPIRIDRVAPTITPTATTASGREYSAGSWTNEAVTVHYACSDSASGILSCSADEQFSHDTSADGTASGASAMDYARNTATATFGPIRIDRTPPSISATAVTADGSAYPFGTWTNEPVTVHYTCTDVLSGIATCDADQHFTENGAFTGFFGGGEDNAGNFAILFIGAVQIDRTAPEITFSGNAGTYEIDETIAITCAATDALSGIAETSCPDVATGLAAAYVTTSRHVTLNATATDTAGTQITAATGFYVNVTSDGVCRLVAEARQAAAICAHVRGIAAAPDDARAGRLKAFDHYLDTLRDMSPEALTVLRRLAQLL